MAAAALHLAPGSFADLWAGPDDLPPALKLEWRMVLGRWLGIMLFAAALPLLHLPYLSTVAAYAILITASAYNLSLRHLIRRRCTLLLDGTLPTVADGVLCAAMLSAAGGFESPFYVVLYAVVVSAGMRLGFRRGILVPAVIACIDGVGKFSQAQALDAGYLMRTGVLFLTVLLTSYLFEEAQKAEAALAERLRHSEVLNTALEHQALHDLLTDLPNRTLLRDRLQQAILANRHTHAASVALLVIDLDRFKDVNDTFGHQYGDLLLQQIGPRLKDVLDEHDVIARLGGDEFAVLLPSADLGRAQRVARRIQACLDEPFAISEHNVAVGGSIGIALAPEHAPDADVLLRRADVAMYEAKRTSRGFVVYAPEHDQHSPERLALLGDLRHALDSDELTLYFQPKVSVRSNRCSGVEALIRWRHPQRGMVPPDEFIPLAEQTGLIRNLSRWVLNAALRQAHAWQAVGFDIPIAVNVSMRDLHDGELPATVAELLKRWQVPPSRLVVEITENGLMAEPARALTTVTGLRAMGIRIAIDDFGTGYSSLAYLKRLPVDELKIDRSFIRDLAEDKDDLAIVRSTIGLGHELGLSVVAEGVEDTATWDMLRALGCDVGQGYYLGRPTVADDVLRQFSADTATTGSISARA